MKQNRCCVVVTVFAVAAFYGGLTDALSVGAMMIKEPPKCLGMKRIQTNPREKRGQIGRTTKNIGVVVEHLTQPKNANIL